MGPPQPPDHCRATGMGFRGAGWTTTQIVEYAYDYNNVWIRKVIGNNKTIFIPENYQTTVQIDNGATTHHYLWTPNQQDKLLADTTTSGILWALTDHLGTIRDVLDGNSSTHLIYDAFGNLTSGTNPLLFGYTGKPFDPATNLQNNINRWYDATIGRWLSTDPIGFIAGDSNLYKYVKNTVLQFSDILGLMHNYTINAINNCFALKLMDFGGVQYRIGQIIQMKSMAQMASSIFIEAAFLGITLPKDLLGKITISTLERVLQELLKNKVNGSSPQANEIREAVIGIIGDSIEDVSPLVPLVTQLMQNSMNYKSSECQLRVISYEQKPTSKLMGERVQCIFYYCAKIKGWLFPSITSWSLSGSCHYTCKDGLNRTESTTCCKNNRPAYLGTDYSASGSGTRDCNSIVLNYRERK